MEPLITILLLALVAALAWFGHQQAEERRRRDEETRLRIIREATVERGRQAGVPTLTTGPSSAAQGGTAVATLTAGATADEPGIEVVHPSRLPSFGDVGGMDDVKRELLDTVGLIVRHADRAAEYGVTWNGILLHGPPGCGKTFLGKAIAGELQLNLVHCSTGDLVRDIDRAFDVARSHRPALLLFDEFDSIATRRELALHPDERRAVTSLLQALESCRDDRGVVVVATTNDLQALDPAVVRPGRFDRHIRIDLPDRAARRAILAEQLEGRPAAADVDLDELAERTRGLTPAALAQVVEMAALAAFAEAQRAGQLVRITDAHLLEALDRRGGDDRPTVEDWSWDRLVLPEEVEAELRQLEALLAEPELARRFGVDPPAGVLLTGPPGTGKTTVAKVLAANARCSFYPVSAADVTSKWAGESERRIRDLFERARANRPSIIFIDEIEALASVRGRDGHGHADRQLDQLLLEMDGVGSIPGVLVIGATNRPDQLDPAIVRGGRLSRTITIPPPDRAARARLLQLMTRRMPTVAVDIGALAGDTDGFTGADLEAVCQQAALNALVRARQQLEDGIDLPAAVHHEDFEQAVAQRRASVTANTGAG